MLKAFLLFLLLSGFSAARAGAVVQELLPERTVVGDDACFVISGANVDRQGVFDFLRNHGEFIRFQGYSHCRIFSGYAELNTFLKTGTLPNGAHAAAPAANAPVVIVAQGHGSDDGSELMDDGFIAPDLILQNIREISILHPVAFYSASCYSGTLLLLKNRWEQQHAQQLAHENSDSVDRVCMWAEALPGRIANGSMSVNEWIQIPVGTDSTFEEAYLRHPLGVVSSAAWGQIQLEPYFGSGFDSDDQLIHQGKEAAHLSQGQNLLSQLHLILNQSESASISPANRAKIDSARFLMSPETGGVDFLKASAALSGSNPVLTQTLFRYLSLHPNAHTCAADVQAEVSKNYYELFRAKSRDFSWGPLLRAWVIESRDAQSPLQRCGSFGSNQTLQDWANWFKDYSPEFAQTLAAYASSFQALLQLEGLPADAPVSSSEELVSYVAGHQNAASPVPSDLIARKQKILDSAVGRFIFSSEYKQDGRTLSPATNFSAGATGNVLPAFVIASITADRLENPLDQRRRNACRAIAIKGPVAR